MLEHGSIGRVEIAIHPELLLDGGVRGLLHLDLRVDLPVREHGVANKIVEYLLFILGKFAHRC